MTSLGPCKSKTAGPTSRAPGGKGPSELARLHDAARRIEPMANNLKRGGFPRPWFRKVPLHPSCSRQAVRASVASLLGPASKQNGRGNADVQLMRVLASTE